MSGQQPPPFQTFIQEGPGWEGIGSKLQYANDYLQVYLATVRTPSRPAGALWTVVHRKAAAVVAPMRADGRLVLIRQERIPVRAALWEFPAGQIDSPGEGDDAAIRATARRELREESGYELGPGGELIAMGCFYSSPGFTDEHAYLFLARGVIPAAGGAEPDENEAIEGCRAFTVEELRGMIAENEVRDANTLSAFARLTALGFI